MGYKLTGDQYRMVVKRISEILRQVGQNEYPFDPENLVVALEKLQAIIEGRFEVLENIVVFKYFTPILDADIPEKYKATGAKYRQLATEQGVPANYRVCYRVPAGYTLKVHAPLSGLCRNKFGYLQDWEFPDEATKDSYVFWVPGVLKGSTSMDVPHQRQFLAETRTRLALPVNHMVDFGSVALVAGLLLAHFKATGERISLVLRTDTCDSGGYRLSLSWREGVLDCDHWYYVVEPYDNVGVPALGVELES